MAETLRSQRPAIQHRLADYFRDRKTRAGVLARRLLGMVARDDAELIEHLVRERRRLTRLDGSVEGALVPTAWLAWELLELGTPPDNAGVVRTVGFLLGRQDQPGRVFGEGCRPYTHEHRICSHYLGGFFSAGPEETRIGPLFFPHGVTVEQERDARFAASCYALRTVIRAGEDRRERVRRHVASLLELDLWSGESDAWSPTLAFFALGGVALAPLDLRERAAQAAARLIGRQQPDGSFPGTDLFHALEMLLAVPTAPARQAVARAAAQAAQLLDDEGPLAHAVGEERALIGLKALALAQELSG